MKTILLKDNPDRNCYEGYLFNNLRWGECLTLLLTEMPGILLTYLLK